MDFVINSDRSLGDEELDTLKVEALLMQRLNVKSQWVGDGMLYQTTSPNEFYFSDQKY